MIHTMVSDNSSHVLRAEVLSLLEDTVSIISLPRNAASQAFKATLKEPPKEEGGLRPILDLRCVNYETNPCVILPCGLAYISGSERVDQDSPPSQTIPEIQI